MEIRINIPKEVIKNDVPQSIKEDVVENRYYNENGEWMEIINSAEFHRYNIRFSSNPNEKIIGILTARRWQYSYHKQIWYPHGFGAAEDSLEFAKQIQELYYNDITRLT